MKARYFSICAALVTSILLAPTAQARSIYCCKDDNGRDACADILPAICSNRAYREINERGMVIKRVDAPLSAEQIAKKEAEKKKAKEEEKLRIEQDRKNRALLETYSSEKDIDYIRDHALAEPTKAIAQAQRKYDEAVKKQKTLAEQVEFYKKRPVPPDLQGARRDNDEELKAQLTIIAEKKKEIDAIKAKYEAEKSRYRELVTRKSTGAPAATGAAGGPPAR